MSNYDEITAQERHDYGDEFLNVVAKQARQATAANTHQLQQSVNALHQTVARAQREQMKAALDKRLPDWRQQNNDQGFLNWLSERDQFSGMTRQQLLSQAWASGDTERVVNIFAGYRNEARQRPAQQQQGASGWGAPSTAAGHTRDWPTTGRPIITGQQINNFYADVVAKRYAHRQEQKNALEAALNLAVKEGRVR